MVSGVRARLRTQFNCASFADCRVQFCIEKPQQEGSTSVTRIGEPVFGHRVLLTLGSEWFAGRFEIWDNLRAGASGSGDGAEGSPSKAARGGAQPKKQQAGKRRREEEQTAAAAAEATGSCGGTGAGDGAGPQAQQPAEVLVPLGSEAELPHALEALRFIYTEGLTPGLGFEALLRVRQQAGYLGVAGCTEACDDALLAWAEAQAGSSGDGSSSSSWVVEAYVCHQLFPQQGGTHEAPHSFARVLEALQPQLLKAFSDAAVLLQTVSLRQQLLALPLCAVEALLASDAFTTDSESSVVALVAWWADANPTAPKEEVQRLWRHVRLSQASPPYLRFLLPLLLDCIPLTPQQLGLVQHYAAEASDKLCSVYGPAVNAVVSSCPSWFTSPARPLGPHAGQATLTWEVEQGRLLAALERVKESGKGEFLGASRLAGAWGSGAPIPAASTVLLQGLRWWVTIWLDPKVLWPAAAQGEGGGEGGAARSANEAPGFAGLVLRAYVPPPLKALSPAGVVMVNATFAVQDASGAQVAVGHCPDFPVALDCGRVWPKAIALDQQAPPQQPGAPPLHPLLRPWARWLHGGKLSGTLDLKFK